MGLVFAALLLVPVGTRALEMRRLTFLSARGEHAEVVVHAEVGQLDPALDVVTLESVRVRLGESGDGDGLEFTCDRGRLDTRSHDFEVRGNVRGRTADGRRFQAPWARYDGSRELLYTDAPVEITDGPIRLRGAGLRYEVASGRMHLLEAQLVHTP